MLRAVLHLRGCPAREVARGARSVSSGRSLRGTSCSPRAARSDDRRSSRRNLGGTSCSLRVASSGSHRSSPAQGSRRGGRRSLSRSAPRRSLERPTTCRARARPARVRARGRRRRGRASASREDSPSRACRRIGTAPGRSEGSCPGDARDRTVRDASAPSKVPARDQAGAAQESRRSACDVASRLATSPIRSRRAPGPRGSCSSGRPRLPAWNRGPGSTR
jgi:hypothetical protein